MLEIVKKDDCIFCRIADHKIPSIIIAENSQAIAIMDINPATPGHILVLPRSHIEDIYSMPSEIGSSIIEMAVMVARAIKKQMNPAGLNVIQSNGAAAGQVIFHFHMHLVPRYEKDAVRLGFGHKGPSTLSAELENIAAQIRKGMAL
jgi:histidine triad (HIT) family protein